MKKRTHWTPSSLKDFETCPAKYNWTYQFEQADWLALGYASGPRSSSPAMDRGTAIHQTCEDFVTGKITLSGLHPAITPAWANLVRGLRTQHAVAEEQWEFDSGWFPKQDASAALWLRMKIDAHLFDTPLRLRVIDYKSGKFYRSNTEQVEVYALGAFSKFEAVQEVITELWYFDGGEPYDKTYKRPQAAKLATKWDGRARKALEATAYPPKPSNLCGWCQYNAKKGGPCHAAA